MTRLIEIFVDVLGPVAAIVGLGFFAGKKWDLDVPTISTLAFRVLGPAFMFRLFLDSSLSNQPVAAMVSASIGSILVVWVGMRLVFRSGLEDRMAATFGNVGNLGFPIVLFALGEQALPSAGIHFLSVTVVALFMGIASAARQRAGGIFGAVRRVLSTPIVVAAPIAGLVRWSSLDVPLSATRAIGLLADAMIPVMLVVLGMQLAGASRRFHLGRLSRVTVIKLLVVPAVYLAIAQIVGLTGIERDSGLLLAAMPTAVLVGLVSMEFDLETEAVTASILVTSLVSVLSLGALIRFL